MHDARLEYSFTKTRIHLPLKEMKYEVAMADKYALWTLHENERWPRQIVFLRKRVFNSENLRGVPNMCESEVIPMESGQYAGICPSFSGG